MSTFIYDIFVLDRVGTMKKYLAKMDLWLLFITIIYAVLGCIMIYSASSIFTFLTQDVSSNYYFIRQSIILIFSLVASIFILNIPTSKYRFFSLFYLLAVIASLIGLYVEGHIANGTAGWYDLGFFSIQPSEFAKSAIIVYMAVTYNNLIKNNDNNFIKYLIPVFACIIMAALILKQPDLGSALIVGALGVLIFIAVPIKKDIKIKCYKIFGVLGVIGVFFIILFSDKIFNEYQRRRLEFQNPCSRYTESTGYQVCNGFIAIKNGGLFGLGFGNSTQKYLYLPESHTDFIFPIIVEELGLIVGIGIIIGYCFMLYRILRISLLANNLRNSILAYGTFIFLLLHILINLLGVLALIPLTGVPLPLLSYGGSFNLNVLALLAVCQKIHMESKKSRLKERTG